MRIRTEVKAGLKQEMPEGSPQRLHSAIMVSTLERLINHGLSNTNGGASDGEIVIDPTKSFSDFLFIYKPENEMETGLSEIQGRTCFA